MYLPIHGIVLQYQYHALPISKSLGGASCCRIKESLDSSPLVVPMNLKTQRPQSVNCMSKLLEPHPLDESEWPLHATQDRAIVRQRERKGHRLSVLLDDKEEIWNGERAELIRECIVFLFGPRDLPITLERRRRAYCYPRRRGTSVRRDDLWNSGCDGS